MEEQELRTRRTKAKYGTRVNVGGTPMLVIKSGKRKDYLTYEEIGEDLFGKKIDHIVFKEASNI